MNLFPPATTQQQNKQTWAFLAKQLYKPKLNDTKLNDPKLNKLKLVEFKNENKIQHRKSYSIMDYSNLDSNMSYSEDESDFEDEISDNEIMFVDEPEPEVMDAEFIEDPQLGTQQVEPQDMKKYVLLDLPSEEEMQFEYERWITSVLHEEKKTEEKKTKKYEEKKKELEQQKEELHKQSEYEKIVSLKQSNRLLYWKMVREGSPTQAVTFLFPRCLSGDKLVQFKYIEQFDSVMKQLLSNVETKEQSRLNKIANQKQANDTHKNFVKKMKEKNREVPKSIFKNRRSRGHGRSGKSKVKRGPVIELSTHKKKKFTETQQKKREEAKKKWEEENKKSIALATKLRNSGIDTKLDNGVDIIPNINTTIKIGKLQPTCDVDSTIIEEQEDCDLSNFVQKTISTTKLREQEEVEMKQQQKQNEEIKIKEKEKRERERKHQSKFERVGRQPLVIKMGPSSYWEEKRKNHPKFVRRDQAKKDIRDKKGMRTTHAKSKMCTSVGEKKKCRHGTRCRFAHTVDELTPAQCRFGQDCTYIFFDNERKIHNKRGYGRTRICAFSHPGESKVAYLDRQQEAPQTPPKMSAPKPKPIAHKSTPVKSLNNTNMHNNKLDEWSSVVKVTCKNEITKRVEIAQAKAAEITKRVVLERVEIAQEKAAEITKRVKIAQEKAAEITKRVVSKPTQVSKPVSNLKPKSYKPHTIKVPTKELAAMAMKAAFAQGIYNIKIIVG